VYVPSFVSSVIKLRSGAMPSLKSDLEGFPRFRKCPDTTSVLFGTNLWGCVYTALACFALFAVVTFSCIWSVSEVSNEVVHLIGYTFEIASQLAAHYSTSLPCLRCQKTQPYVLAFFTGAIRSISTLFSKLLFDRVLMNPSFSPQQRPLVWLSRLLSRSLLCYFCDR
jgi:hypothetical protein